MWNESLAKDKQVLTQVISLVEKMVESRLRWFGHVWRRYVEAPI